MQTPSVGRVLDAGELAQVDALIEEYLLFRGFVGTRHAFAKERKADKNHAFQVRNASSRPRLALAPPFSSSSCLCLGGAHCDSLARVC